MYNSSLKLACFVSRALLPICDVQGQYLSSTMVNKINIMYYIMLLITHTQLVTGN